MGVDKNSHHLSKLNAEDSPYSFNSIPFINSRKYIVVRRESLCLNPVKKKNITRMNDSSTFLSVHKYHSFIVRVLFAFHKRQLGKIDSQTYVK